MSENPASPEMDHSTQRILVTGATGYVGGRLVPALLDRGYAVRCLVRSPRKLELRSWHGDPRVEIVKADLGDEHNLQQVMSGCSVAYYLVHAMVSAGKEFAEQDRLLALHFAAAAEKAGITRIIYLGGLGELGGDLSKHLRSRREVEESLNGGRVPVTTLRAAMIIGSGSASFEILRYLVERLPIMITPRWVSTKCQPVAIRDVLHWLVRCLEVPETTGKVLEIGCPEVLSYRELMQIAAEELQLPRRIIVSVPVLTPRLSSGWISLVTPVSFQIARPLAEGLRNEVVVDPERSAQNLMPHTPLSSREAIRRAIAKTNEKFIETRWSAAGPVPGDPDWAGGKVFEDRRSIRIDAEPMRVFRAVCRVGGGHGWYAADVLWRIRGWMDQAVGGPGLRRGRRHPENVEYGEALDFWRVVGIEPGRSLLLHAEMKLPGIARLEFEMLPLDHGASTELVMTARFRPRGLAGLAYWYAVLPLHHLVFSGMLQGIKRAAEASRPNPSDDVNHGALDIGNGDPSKAEVGDGDIRSPRS
jgi:uncharacterized protein YbjT (DUF2867 family)